MIRIVKSRAGEPEKNKDGKYIFTNGDAYFTLSQSDFREMRAAMAKIETMIEHEKYRSILASVKYEP